MKPHLVVKKNISQWRDSLEISLIYDNPRFFTNGFIAAYYTIHGIYDIYDIRKYIIIRMFDFNTFTQKLEKYTNENNHIKHNVFSSWQYQYIKTQCETRDRIIQSGGFQELLGGQLYLDQIYAKTLKQNDNKSDEEDEDDDYIELDLDLSPPDIVEIDWD